MAQQPDKEIAANWNEDCLRTHGRILNGKYKHWCPDWDFMPIDETCDEFNDACVCELGHKE